MNIRLGHLAMSFCLLLGTAFQADAAPKRNPPPSREQAPTREIPASRKAPTSRPSAPDVRKAPTSRPSAPTVRKVPPKGDIQPSIEPLGSPVKRRSVPAREQAVKQVSPRRPPALRPEDQPMMLGEPPAGRAPAAKRGTGAAGRTTPRPASRPPVQRPADRRPPPDMLPQVNVIGDRPEEFNSIPGSADVVDQKTLKRTAPISASEALRQVTGVHVSDEDGMGLRLNVGFRGLDPVRSRKILVLEDGIPVSMAPYGEPEMYYTPHIARMQRLEVVKGSGSILWGPQTIGGVLNLVTKDPPRRLRLTGEARYGSYNYFMAHASVGDTVGKFGYLIEAIHQRADGFRKLNLVVTDVGAKLRFQINSRSVLGLKLHFYDEISNATYLGLTTPQYLNDPSQNHATNDRFPIRRYSLAISHKHFFGRGGLLTTTLYAHTISRFWQRQDYERASVSGRQYERVINGTNQLNPNAPNDGSSIFFLDSTGNRNRAFTVGGLETRYTLEFATGIVAHELMAGVRLHSELGEEQYLIGENGNSPSGLIRDHEDRGTLALALYLQYRLMFLNRRLQITPGFRFELMGVNRHLARTRALVPGTTERVIKDVDIRESSLMYAPIPGLGISYQAADGLHLFTGVHRGFAPPRTKDSITADGEDLELAPEFSWNAELGLRFARGNFLQLQAAGFVLYFENQVIPPSESSGAVATDPNNLGKAVINGGQTIHAGAELSATFDLPALLNTGFRMPLTVNYTWIPVAQFSDGKYIGNRLPYAPEHMLTARLGFSHRVGLDITITANLISGQTTDQGESITPSVDGLIGEIAPRFLLDARIAYTFRRNHWSLGAFIAGKNLTNTMYISSRRPSGIQPGTPLQIFGGIQGSL